MESEGRELTAEEFSEKTNELFGSQDFDFAAFDTLLAAAEPSAEYRETLDEGLKKKVGVKFSRLLMENREYRAGLAELKGSLTGKLEEDGPEILAEKSLENLVSLQEMLGPDARKMVETINLRSYTDKLKHRETTSALTVRYPTFHEETGELIDAGIDVNMYYETEDGAEAIIKRQFLIRGDAFAQPDEKPKKVVHHELIKLPDSLKQYGIAANLTSESLKQYDEAGCDEIVLHADIDMGGYTWATYGYGWDEAAVGQMHLEDQEKKKALSQFDENKFKENLLNKEPKLTPQKIKERVSAEQRRLVDKAGYEARKRFAKMSPQEKLKTHHERVKELAAKGLEKFSKALAEAGLPESDPQAQAAIREFQDALANPESITPQTLAAVGRGGPFLYQGKSKKWYTKENFEAAVAAGTDSENPSLKGPTHAGKISLTNEHWFGRIELKASGAQQGKNRTILERKISRSTEQ
ncbi:hypothetical protein HZC53_00955 [Candidatus Uhrbacteria bacterium]|nr:hypothetical protein [Candidatus Uhrbacteria bacterium]